MREGVFKQLRVGLESVKEGGKATEHKGIIVDGSTYLPSNKDHFWPEGCRVRFLLRDNSIKLYIGRSDGAARNAQVRIGLLLLRARSCDLHQNDDFHNWEGFLSEACVQLFYRKRSDYLIL